MNNTFGADDFDDFKVSDETGNLNFKDENPPNIFPSDIPDFPEVSSTDPVDKFIDDNPNTQSEEDIRIPDQLEESRKENIEVEHQDTSSKDFDIDISPIKESEEIKR